MAAVLQGGKTPYSAQSYNRVYCSLGSNNDRTIANSAIFGMLFWRWQR